jgi:hypothetical protein
MMDAPAATQSAAARRRKKAVNKWNVFLFKKVI